VTPENTGAAKRRETRAGAKSNIGRNAEYAQRHEKINLPRRT
jgi:hypothetical protein